MPAVLDTPIGPWWRFDRYLVSDGYIRPAARAMLEHFDPWAGYRDYRRDGASDELPPYLALVGLVADLRSALSFFPDDATGRHRVVLAPEGEERLARWCARWGLLGILPHQACQVTLAPRYEAPPDSADHGLITLAARRYVRTNDGWTPRLSFGSPVLVGQSGRHGELVASVDLPPGGPYTGLVRQDWRTGEWVQERLSRTWARFFPGVAEVERETHQYPLPLSDDFWRLYSEPVADFLAAADTYSEALGNLISLRGGADLSDANILAVVRGAEALHSLLAPVRPAITARADGSHRQHWAAPSLLASFAMMALQDLTEGRRVHRCENETCRRLFVSKAYQARYCSRRCRSAAEKRRQRARKQPAD